MQNYKEKGRENRRLTHWCDCGAPTEAPAEAAEVAEKVSG